MGDQHAPASYRSWHQTGGRKGTSSHMIEVRWGSHWTWMSCMRDQWSGRSQQRGMEGWQLCHGNLQPVSVSVGAQFTLPSLNLTDAACYVCKCQYMCSSEVHVVYKSWSNKRFLVYLKCKPFFFFYFVGLTVAVSFFEMCLASSNLCYLRNAVQFVDF